ncbi:hypothetical protein QLX08_005905 [Tetragonisca angustula]|uniref:Endonuclease/exonuclease/phosphatase domain-containing protein n=1 Tax=Tetragonisca angustula TaxID=166442 RepID=A0AAW0ZWD4_9HYME
MSSRALFFSPITHRAGAQDFMIQTLAEWGVGLTVIAEPYRDIDGSDMISDTIHTVAIYRTGKIASPPAVCSHSWAWICSGGMGRYLCHRGVYALPLPLASWPLDMFDNMLLELGNNLQSLPNQSHIIIMGDFNAESTLWSSSRTDPRERLFIE